MGFHVAVFAAGLVAGFLNVMAGGGSLITLPILLFLGLPVAAANGTNRIAILVQNVVAVTSFRRQGHSEFRTGLGFALVTVPGALAGAFVAIRVSETAFRLILAGVLAVAMVGLVLPKRKRDASSGTVTPAARLLAFVGFFAIGFYGDGRALA